MQLWYLLFVPFLCGFQITEIMYDPEGNDNNQEYIELFTNATSLSDILFEDLASSDTLTLMQDFATPYVLIVEEGFNLTDLNVTAYTTGATLGNNLNNDRDLVLFRDNESISDVFFYVSDRDGASNDGHALCRSHDIFTPCSPTPGLENDLNQTTPEQNYTLRISEFLPDPIGDDRASRPGGEWIELYNYGEETLDLRGLLLEDARNATVVISDMHVTDPLLTPNTYQVVYLQGQSLLNNAGFEQVKLSTPLQLLDQVSYSFSKEGLSWSQDFTTNSFSLSVPTPGASHRPVEVSLNSSLVLERVYVGNDDVVRFGESFRVRLRVYKGDTEKTTLKVSVLNLSKQTTVSIEEKFVEHVFTLTIPLLSNCQGKLKDGTYTVVAEGLDTLTTLPVTIRGTAKDSCVILEQNTSSSVGLKEAQQSSATVKKETVQRQVSDNFINATGRLVYESSDAKAKRWAVYFFCLTLLLVIAALLTNHG
ncbi:hypothetical protein J4208_04870 [Candidatus Woesearchaeota archaeon]|nr:hypothetical protein [Candidatus Woesearchaeota archaeon]